MFKRGAAAIVAVCGIFAAAIITDFGNELFGSATASGPLRIDVQSDIDQISLGPATNGGEYWFPLTLARLPRPPEVFDTCMGRYQWAHRHGGVDAGLTYARVVLSADKNEPVAITGLHVLTTARRARPTSGVVASCPGRGEGPPSVHVVDVDLDRRPAKVVSYPAGSVKPDPTFAFTLSPGQSQIFDLVASSGTCYCEWEGRLSVSVNGVERELAINDRKHPFVTTAPGGRVVRFDEHRWIDYGPAGP